MEGYMEIIRDDQSLSSGATSPPSLE